MAQGLRTFSILEEDKSLFAGTHMMAHKLL